MAIAAAAAAISDSGSGGGVITPTPAPAPVPAPAPTPTPAEPVIEEYILETIVDVPEQLELQRSQPLEQLVLPLLEQLALLN